MDITFPKGFISITGETGAGKSIMLGALFLVLGQRADQNVLWDKEKKCIVEAEFLLEEELEDFFNDNDLDYSSTTILRREITPNGKSRAFINDTPVSLSIQKELSEKLIDIHSQNSTQTLKNSIFQFSIVDSYIEDKSLLNEYKELYLKWATIKKKIQGLEEKENEFLKEKSYFEFLSTEFEKAQLEKDEQELLEKDIELLSNAQQIKETIFNASNSLNGEGEINVLNSLQQVKQNISKLSSFSKELEEIYKRIEEAFIELKDINFELNSFNDTIIADDNLLEKKQDRLNLIYSLEKKHQVNSIEELLRIRDEIDDKLLVSSNLEDEIGELKTKEEKLYTSLKDIAKKITKQRREASQNIEEQILPLFSLMGMQEARIKIEIKEIEHININGEDEINFLFNANKGGVLQDISKVISGGELSRLMLALKAILSRRHTMPTIIFDEIDTGVSGDIASKVGEIMLSMSFFHQVIAITHLPQIASKANYHYKVSKKVDNNTTYSNMQLLNKEERINEIALMISNGKITPSAIALAKELLT
jgi:DNA repair protein RecN (Recombination protein N)